MQTNMSECAAAHGFTLKQSEVLPEISGTAHIMSHNASKARLLFLQNSDSNKAFSITFKTPAADDTGVFHILEHSVLCGSKKFPVKEPFVDLLKSSMQTFLNAMTFPDKTMYPVASTNDADLKNLADVYMDAVFNPNIYTNRKIFEQEGWHLEVQPEEAGEGGGGLTYNGVVYNEMKGALSDADSVLYDGLSAALFPDTTYFWESGGVPAHIPDLSYEAFLDTHARHYRPDNSYIILYGDVDIDDFLAFLDEQYLSPLAARNDAPRRVNEIGIQSPHRTFGKRVYMQTTPEQASYAVGLVAGPATDRKRIFCVDILLDAIAGSNVAPLKRAVLDAKLASDFRIFLNDSVAQPFVMMELKGLTPRVCGEGGEGGAFGGAAAPAGAGPVTFTEKGVDTADALRDVVQGCVRKLAEGGLDRGLISAAIARSEFVLREHDFGLADGVVYAMSVMSGWLYDDAHTLSYLKYEDAIEFAKTALSQGYFEQLLRELFLENELAADCELVASDVPTQDAAQAACVLERLADELGSAEFAAIKADCDALQAAQSAPDSPEALATLARLTPKDIGPAPTAPDVTFKDLGPYSMLQHDIDTHGIAYFYRYFDLECIAFEDVAYASIMCMLLGRLGTKTKTAEELDQSVQLHLGNMDFHIEVHEILGDATKLVPKLCVSASALAGNASYAASLVNEVLLTTDFYDTDKIHDILVQRKVSMEHFFATSGNAAALMRVSSYYSYAGVLREKMAGIDFYMFLRDLLDNYDVRKEALSDKLFAIARTVFNDDATLLSFAGPGSALNHYMRAGAALGVSRKDPTNKLVVPDPVDRHEAFVVPCDISFAALGANRRNFDSPYSGAWILTSRILSFDYLWNTVRVQGGAYGVSFKSSRSGSSYFSSYRDPHLDETLARFADAGSWVAAFKPARDEFDGYIVSAVAGIDTPIKPRAMLKRQDSMYFSGFTQADRDRLRAEVLACTPADISALAPTLNEIAAQNHTCAIGSADIINASKQGFNVIDLFKPRG